MTGTGHGFHNILKELYNIEGRSSIFLK